MKKVMLVLVLTSLAVAASRAPLDGQPTPKDQPTPEHVRGIHFEVLADKVWLRPLEPYEEGNANISLRITNETDNECTFNLNGTIGVGLSPADDKGKVAYASIPKDYLKAKRITIAAGKSETVMLPTRLVHTRIGQVFLTARDAIDLFRSYLTSDVTPGKYRLSLQYENDQKDSDCWLRKATTKAVDVEVKPAKQAPKSPPTR